MTTNSGSTARTNLGDAITAAYDLSRAVTSNRAAAGDLAARHLERVLVRGSNARLIAALTDLARELRPTRPDSQLPFRDRPALSAHAR